MSNETEFATPMMVQYVEIKKRYKDCILLFRLGDFYEMFMEDAKVGASVLNITLTRRSRGKDGDIPMCGVPYHALDNYLGRLVKAGYKVAICEQLTEPIKGAELVERDVVRIVTPGTLLHENSLEKKENNYIACIVIKNKKVGLAIADISTGSFKTIECDENEKDNFLINELAKYRPSECLLDENSYNNPSVLKLLRNQSELNITNYPTLENKSDAVSFLCEHFGIKSLDGFGVANFEVALIASATLLKYLKYTQKDRVHHIKKIGGFETEDKVELDRATINNLELFYTIRDGNKKGSLINHLDKTTTAMGGRLLKNWVLNPLLTSEKLELRYNAVEEFLKKRKERINLQLILNEVSDLERILSRLAVGIGNPKDINALKESLKRCVDFTSALADFETTEKINGIKGLVKPTTQLIKYLDEIIVNDPPFDPKGGDLIKDGVDKELDKLRKTIHGSKKYILKLEEEEKKKTGITTLKIRFNQVFGYYIEITKSYLEKAPQNYIRKQTLVNAERFITPELKQHEEIILTAEEKIKQIEYEIFLKTVEEILRNTFLIQEIAQNVAEIDCLICFAELAELNSYVRPVIKYDGRIVIKEGRHPVVEKLIEEKEFVPNDVELDQNENQLILLTGPNMAGKSVYIRQVALIVLMAQIGCFVPAKHAEISLVDKIFVRSGASDVITSGLSTFMVEMIETANILNNATKNSLIIMDEIGRGTSTYDGISISWAIAEFLIKSAGSAGGPKTLFATHYHELQELENQFPHKIKNYQVLAKEEKGEPVFLHKVQRGGADHSFGIAVAKLAGVPKEICERAWDNLHELEKRVVHSKDGLSKRPKEKTATDLQKLINEIDISRTTPLEALTLLSELKNKHLL